MRELTEHRPGGGITNAISNAVVQIVHEYTGRGPTKCRTTVNRDSVLVVLGETMTKAERKLAEIGREDYVLQTRKEFQRAMRDDLVAAVETIIEREVIAFMSDNSIDPDMAAEVFILRPQAEGELYPSEGTDPIEGPQSPASD